MNNKIELLDAVGAVYSAPGDPQGWNTAVKTITDLVNGKVSGYFLIDTQTSLLEVSAFCGLSEEDQARYQGPQGMVTDARYYYLDNLIPGKAFRDFEFVPDQKVYDESEWIQYTLNKLGVYWCLSAKISTHGLWQDIFSINRLKELGPFTDQEKSDFQLLIPHIAQAAELCRTVRRLETRFNAVLSVLDFLLVGIIILDQHKRVAVSNSTAQEICENTGVASINDRRIFKAANSDENLRINQLIDNAISTSTASAIHNGGQITLTRHHVSVLAEVMPIKDDGFPDGDHIQGAAIFLIDINCSHVVTLEGIAQIFKLTQAETQVARLVTNGVSINDVADERRTSVDTIRKQIKSVYAKTGASSQLELLRLATKATPPIKTDENDQNGRIK